MSKVIDERVVSMQFDNKQFESNVQTTMGTLDKLKQSLKFTGATKGFEDIDNASKKVNFLGLGRAVETVQARFSAMEVMAVTALANITNSAVNAGKRIASALTIKPITTGFQEYETQINAVQTILANTESKGTTLQDVNRALDELNTYADKTIYNFTQMTKNIGTFTAAGVDLDTSVSAIKGIANLAAVSGSTSQQASTAMYQLSQALAAGRVSLMDWNSVVNAGMGGQVFQDALKRTSELLGTGADAAIKKYGSFRESLTQGEWLTVDVLTKTLEQFTMAAEEGSAEWETYKKSLMDDGYTEQQALDILKMANTATDAATKVKTLTQLWDTLQESAQSGWTQTWEIIMGDFGEAKELYTKISDTIGEMLTASADARNTMLAGGLSTGWKQLLNAGIADEAGYVESLKTVAKTHNVSIDDMIAAEKKLDETLSDSEAFQIALKKGLTDGTLSSNMLSEAVDELAKKMSGMSNEERKAAGYTAEHIEQIKALNDGIKDGSVSMDDFAKKIMRSSGRENLIDALFNSFNAVMAIIKPVKEAFSEIFPAITGDQVYSLTEKIRDFTATLTVSEETADKIKRAFKGIFSIFDMFKKVIGSVAKVVGGFLFSDGVSGVADLLLNIAASIGDFFTSLNDSFNLDNVTGSLSDIVSVISDALGKAVGGLSGFGESLSGIGDFIINIFKNIGKGISEVFSWIGDNFSTTDIFAGLAGGGIFLLAKKLMELVDKVKEKFEGFFGKGEKKGMFDTGKLGELTDSLGEVFGSLNESLQAFTTGIKVGSLVAIAIAIGILANALETISGIEVQKIVKSLFAMGAMFVMLNLSFKSISKTVNKFQSKGVIKAGFAMILLAKAIDILAGPLEQIGKMPLKDILKGLFGIGVAMGELVAAIKLIGATKISIGTSIAVLALAKACEILGDALAKFAKLSWDEIGRGLTAMGGALGEIVIAIKLLGSTKGLNSIASSGAVYIVVQSLGDMADALAKFGKMSWKKIGRGLSAMGGALAEVGTTIGILGKFVGFSSIFGAIAVLIGAEGLGGIADALEKFGNMSWDQIGRGLAAMGGALGELGITIGLLGGLTGFGGILGAGALVAGIQGLDELAEALKKFGSMAWDEIGRGLAAMGGALGEVAIISGGLGYLTGIGGIFGAGTIWIAIQGLDDLATSFKKFADMSWEEIGRGLVGMGGALAEVGIVSGALGYLTNIAGLLGAATIWTAVQGLSDLADSFKKFGEMSWDEIGRGLSAMGGALAEVALGSIANTIGIIGSMTISNVAEPLGTLADSMKKWKDVSIPADLPGQLALLAVGISAYTFDGFGAWALATAAEPIGVLADSIKKWKDVSIPEGLAGKVTSLAGSIAKYTFDGFGASALATAAPAVGMLADSIKKWEGLTVSEKLAEDLTALADAIGAFTWTFMGGWSLSSIAEPFATFTTAVAAWKDVTIPDGLSDDLTDLANGINQFGLSFAAGWSLSALIQPMKDLVGAVKAWNGVSVPENLSKDLKSLAEGIKAFKFNYGFTSMAEPLNNVADAVSKLAGVKMGTLGTDLSTLGSSIATFATSCEGISGVGDKIIDNIVTPIENAADNLSTAGSDIINSISDGITESVDTIIEAISSVVDDGIDSIFEKETSANKAGSSLVEFISKGIKSLKTTIYTAGEDLGTGLINGIRSKETAAYNAGYALGQKAVQGEKDGQASNSPSKLTFQAGKWLGEGLINGMDAMSKKVYNAGHSLGDTAANTMSTAASKIADSINTNIDSQPTIRPVLDLSDIESGANIIGGMFGLSTLGVTAMANGINMSMNARSQNGINDDVVAAINKLDKHLDNVGGTSYNINGITYDDGSSISEAIKTLIRAARVERRM